MIDYESEVKSVYPDAIEQKHRTGLYYIQGGDDGYALGASAISYEIAWVAAYQNLVQQGKIKGE